MRSRAPRVFHNEQRGVWMFGCEEVTPQPITFSFVAGVDLDNLPEMHKAGYAAARPGGWDPKARLEDMTIDGVSAEVLYPSLGLGLYWIKDPAFQEACFRAYNDWLIEYCSVEPNRLVGVAAISVYDVERGVAELERCRKAGLRGALIWQAPHPDLPFHSKHYDRFWASAQDLDAPVSMHILTGHSYHARERKGIEHYRGSVNLKLADVANALFELIFYGVLERNPGLRLVTVENEAGWLPFMVQQWDYYYRRFREKNPPPFTREPGEYMREQVYSCFFNDAVCGRNLEWWGQDNLMWSNDFPHPNSTWPNSLKVIQRHLGHLPAEIRAKVLSANACRLYGLDVSALPAGVSRAAQAAQAAA